MYDRLHLEGACGTSWVVVAAPAKLSSSSFDSIVCNCRVHPPSPPARLPALLHLSPALEPEQVVVYSKTYCPYCTRVGGGHLQAVRPRSPEPCTASRWPAPCGDVQRSALQ